MKLKLFSVLALSGLIATGVACGDSETDDDGEGGEGGSGGQTGTTKTGSTKTTGAMNTSPASTVSTASAAGTCADIGACEGDGTTPDSGCFECAVLGDATTASDGGSCAAAYSNCYGDGSAECTGAGEPECCQIYDCIEACDANANGMIEAGAELDCFCTNDGAMCVQMQMPGSCFGDFPDGLQAALEWEGCFFGESASDSGVCGDVCG